jgi:PAS domain S-box-containing protein
MFSIELSQPDWAGGQATRFAWMPIPLLLAAILASRLAGLHEDYPYDHVRLVLSVIFYTVVSLTTLVLIGRSFVKSGKPGLLLLECGVVLWSLSGTVGDAVSHGDQNVNATIFNLTILLAGMCHLAGATLSLTKQRELRARRLWLMAGFGVALGALGVITWAALANRTPLFFVPGQGGTPVRTAVLIAAVAIFLLSAILLRVGQGGTTTRFVQWYCLALLLLAVGLFGIMIQTSIGCIVNWLARSAQWLGGTYLLVAAIAAVRETGRWEVSLDSEIWDDRLLRVITPYLLRTFPATWRYGLAILVVIAATSLRWALVPSMGTTSPYNLTIVALVAVAIFLGTGPALLTVVLGDIAVEAFVMGAARTGFTRENLSRLVIAMATGLLVCWVLHTIRCAARKIQKNEARLAAFAEATFEGICESEGDLVVDCNEQFAQMTGAMRSELIGASISDMVAPQDCEVVSANIRENRESVIEHEMLRRDGTRITVESHGRPVAPGSSRRYTAVRDITERRSAEEALRQLNAELEQRVAARTSELVEASRSVQAERRRLFDVLETLPAMICLLTPDYHVAFANRSFRERFAESQGRHCYEYCFGSDAPCKFCESYRVLATGQPHQWEVTTPDGGVIDVHDFPFTDADGSTLILEMNIDITDQRRAEREIQRAHEDLATRANQLRALAGELTLSEQRERSRLAKILHDHLQQLLVAAKFRVTILGRGGDELVKQVTREVEALIDESIASSRSLTAELSPPILHEAGLKAGLEWLARRMTDKQGLFVDLEIGEDADLPQESKLLLFESVRELLFNVVKHARAQSATVNVRRINDHLQVVVSDSGIGFDPAGIPAVGEGGRGFGLFSIRERVELMGGTFAIESNPGQGSRITLSLPVTFSLPVTPSVKAKAPQLPGRIMLPQAPSAPPGFSDAGCKIRVMLVDDHAVVRQGMANLLGDEPDIEVVGEAANGREAVEAAARLLPDVILMDLSLPELNGVEATRIIHNDWPGIRIIGLSMFEEADSAQAMRDAGAMSYVTKSGPATDLIDTIRTSIRADKTIVVKAKN